MTTMMDRTEWSERVTAAASTFTTEVAFVHLPNRANRLVKRWYVKLFVLDVRVDPDVLGNLPGARAWWATRKAAVNWAAGIDSEAVGTLVDRSDYLNWADSGFAPGYDPIVEAIAEMEAV